MREPLSPARLGSCHGVGDLVLMANEAKQGCEAFLKKEVRK